MENEKIPYDDPRFVEILEACLRVEIATHKESYDKTQAEIRKIKRNVLMKLDKRKELKTKIKDAEEVISMLNLTCQRLWEDSKEMKQRIDLIEANADDRSKLMFLEIREYENVLQKYQTTWESYRTEYEDFPLAKKRKEAEINLKKVTIEKMILEYKIKDAETKIEIRKKIDNIRMRLKIIEFAKAMVNNDKLERRFVELKNKIYSVKRQQRSKELELKDLERQEEEEKRKRAMTLLEMPPPKIKLSRLRLSYSTNWSDLGLTKKSSQIDSDSMSVNTIALEEMCIREETQLSTTKENDIGNEPSVSTSTNDQKLSTIKPIAKRSVATVATTPLQKTHSKNRLSFSSNPSQSMIAKQRSFVDKNEHNRCTTPMCVEEEYSNNYNRFVNDSHESKRMKFGQNEEQNNSENLNSVASSTPKRSTLYPQIMKIEKVKYGIEPSTKRKNAFNISNNFDYDTNASRGSSFVLNESMMIKELAGSRSLQPSMYDDNSGNFQISELANISNLGDSQINMDSMDGICEKINRKENEKEATSPPVTSGFNFANLFQLKAGNNFHIF